MSGELYDLLGAHQPEFPTLGVWANADIWANACAYFSPAGADRLEREAEARGQRVTSLNSNQAWLEDGTVLVYVDRVWRT